MTERFARGDVPSKESFRNFVRDLFQLECIGLKEGDLVKVNHSAQSKKYDIRVTTLNNIYAQLELNCNLLRAITPEYSKYEYKKGPKFEEVTKDTSPAAAAIRRSATFGRTKYTLDVGQALDSPSSAGLHRGALVRKLNDWSDSGVIELTASGVTNVYRVLKGLPSTPDEIEYLVNGMYRIMEYREGQAIERAENILNLITSAGCYAKRLALHFGDDLPDEKSECGHCSWCMTHKVVERQDSPPVPFNDVAFRAVLDTIKERDDPRFLARVAFGMSSPRVTAMKLGKHPIFMSMADHGWEVSIILDYTYAKYNN